MNRLIFPIILLLLAAALPVFASPNPGSEAALKKAIATGKPTVLQFGAPWCHSCSILQPIIEAVAKEKRYSDKMNFIHVDVDHDEALRSTYRITSIPVIVFLNGSGKEVGRRFGPVERPELLKILDRTLSSP